MWLSIIFSLTGLAQDQKEILIQSRLEVMQVLKNVSGCEIKEDKDGNTLDASFEMVPHLQVKIEDKVVHLNYNGPEFWQCEKDPSIQSTSCISKKEWQLTIRKDSEGLYHLVQVATSKGKTIYPSSKK